MLHKNYSLIIFLMSFLFLTSFVSAVTVNVTTEPASYYSDTKDVNLHFNFENLNVAPVSYCFDFSEQATVDYSIVKCTDTDNILCQKNFPNCTTTFGFKSTETSGTTDVVLSISSLNSTKIEDSFSWDLCKKVFDACSQETLDQTSLSQDVKSGKPSFDVKLTGSQSGVKNQFNKVENISIDLVSTFEGQNFDNVDDAQGNNLNCVGKIDTTEFYNNPTINSTTFDGKLGLISAKNYVGKHTVNVNCNDGGLDSAEQKITFKVTDKLPKVDSITFSPEKIYPDTKVTCNAIISDEDDPASLDKTFAWKFKGQSTTNTTNQFDCTTNKCVSGDTLTCIVTPKNNQIGQSATKETTVQSYFSTVKISAPSKVQVSQEASFTADVTYTGKGTVTYNWIFGDSSSGTGKSVKHTYTSKGEFTVTLTVNDGKNSSGETTTTISVVDADLIISIKSPVTNQEVTKGEALNVKVGLNDNTGTPITDANVTALVKSGDKNYSSTVAILKPISNTPGLYETDMKMGYLIPTQSEIEISANYNKGTIKMFNKKSVPISLTPFDNIIPQFEMETQYDEQNETELTVGNTIDKLLVCFALPQGNGFDNAMVGTKLILEGVETTTIELKELEGSCYATYPNYKVSKQDLDNAIAFKFKDPKDIYGNYVKSSFEKEVIVVKEKSILKRISEWLMSLFI